MQLEREGEEGRTRLMKMMRSSGTPCSLSTSTALMADPPVAVRAILKSTNERDPRATQGRGRRTEHGIEQQNVPLRNIWRELHAGRSASGAAESHTTPPRKRERHDMTRQGRGDKTHLGVKQLRLRGLLVLFGSLKSR